MEFHPSLAKFAHTGSNHLRYDLKYLSDSLKPDSITIRFGTPKEGFVNFADEAIAAARLIFQSMPKPLYLCLSGGVDSEAMAQVFLMAQVPFTPVIMRFPNRLNEFDINYAFAFCERHALRPEVIDLDPLNFYREGEHFDWCHQYRCRSPHFSVHFKLAKILNPGTSIFPWQAPTFIPLGERNMFTLPEDHHLAYLRFAQGESLPMVPFFFLYTPNLLKSFFSLPSLKNILATGKVTGDYYELKVSLYNEAGLRVQRRPQKWTGFEKIKKLLQAQFATEMPIYEELYRYPLQRRFAYPLKFYHELSRNYFSELQINNSMFFIHQNPLEVI